MLLVLGGGAVGRFRAWLATAGAVLTGAVLGGAVVLLVTGHLLGGVARQQPALAASASPAAAVFRRVAPAVVLVSNQGAVVTWFGPQQRTGWGSGVIFDARGYIVTNDHVVAGARRLTVVLADGRSLPAEVVGGDPATDLAVVRVRAGRPLPVAAFGATAVVPGEVAIAIGNPLGPQFKQSVTQGVVSAVRPMLYGLDPGDRRVTEMIQTDAAINPGNSGGPLCDAAGLVIGINSIQVPMVAPGIAAAGLGFAIPAATVLRVADDLVRFGYVKRAWLGAALQVQPPEALPGEPQSVEVGRLVPGGPAERAGLQVGERLLGWDGVPIQGYYDLVLRVNNASPGQRVRLTVSQGGATRALGVVLGVAPQPAAAGR